MSGANAPEILAAYEAVRSDKDDTNWLLISYALAVGDKLTLSSTGTGGLSELTTKLDPSQAQYAYVDARDKGDLEEGEIVVRLRKAGGADYNGGRG
ncbi:Coactosin [Lachnellula suecica]|uniref:Coactosin n=1 Tax=Lachnellula suecica TaxID=602035 RepID=A0A8T9CIW8_9HELO|nr:Coactosin [Lachnellula suecica]